MLSGSFPLVLSLPWAMHSQYKCIKAKSMQSFLWILWKAVQLPKTKTSAQQTTTHKWPILALTIPEPACLKDSWNDLYLLCIIRRGYLKLSCHKPWRYFYAYRGHVHIQVWKMGLFPPKMLSVGLYNTWLHATLATFWLLFCYTLAVFSHFLVGDFATSF